MKGKFIGKLMVFEENKKTPACDIILRQKVSFKVFLDLQYDSADKQRILTTQVIRMLNQKVLLVT